MGLAYVYEIVKNVYQILGVHQFIWTSKSSTYLVWPYTVIYQYTTHIHDMLMNSR